MASNVDMCSTSVEERIHFWLFSYNVNGILITNENELKDLCASYMSHLYSYIKDYVWFCEPFSLNINLKISEDDMCGTIGPHIGGSMMVDDYLEDEWFALFLLLQLTKEFPSLICRIIDNDGEFVLVEAANELPQWVDPNTADRRVYLKEGLIHLIPRSVIPLSSGIPSVMDALETVHSKPSATLASSAVQKAIHLRIEEYPRKISKEHHSTHAFVPVSVAALLQEYPTLVSAAVRAFANRDAADNNKCLRVMRHFPPETRVLTSVRFSKALYALLTSRPYTPDPCTGWNISKNNNAHIVGMKLACGFEILVSRAGGITPIATPDEFTFEADNPKWEQYKKTLTEKGYFRGELEGSALYKNLEGNAQRFFAANDLMSRASKDDIDALPLGSIVVKLLSKVNTDLEAFKKKEKDLLPPDDESWLEVSPDSFEQLLESKFQQGDGTASKKTSDRVTAESLNEFLKNSSSLEGSEIPPELLQGLKNDRKVSRNGRKTSGHRRKPSVGLSVHPQHRKISSNSNASDASDMSSFSAKIDFNADSFNDALNNILEYSVPEDEYFVNGESDASSGMSSYDEDEEKDLSLSRKTSGESSSSRGSSGIECQPIPPPRKKKFSKSHPQTKKIPLASLDDEFDTEESDTKFLKGHDEEEKVTGPPTAMLTALNIQSNGQK